MATDERAREGRLRRLAWKQGPTLKKSRSRIPEHRDYGRYWLIDPDRGTIEAGRDEWLSLDEVELSLTESVPLAAQPRPRDHEFTPRHSRSGRMRF